MPERTTTREQWEEIAADFDRVFSVRGIQFADACIEMGFDRDQYHRMRRCLQDKKKSRPHSQDIIDRVIIWTRVHDKKAENNNQKPLRRSKK